MPAWRPILFRQKAKAPPSGGERTIFGNVNACRALTRSDHEGVVFTRSFRANRPVAFFLPVTGRVELRARLRQICMLACPHLESCKSSRFQMDRASSPCQASMQKWFNVQCNSTPTGACQLPGSVTIGLHRSLAHRVFAHPGHSHGESDERAHVHKFYNQKLTGFIRHS